MNLQELVFINYDEYQSNNYDGMIIGENAFKGCSGVTHVYLSAFNSEHRDIWIEQGVVKIGENAFDGCGTSDAPVNIYTGETEVVKSEFGWHINCFLGANLADSNVECIVNVDYKTYLSIYSLYGKKVA